MSAACFDIGEADGILFLTMEYVDGEDLASVVRRIGRLSPDKARRLPGKSALALQRLTNAASSTAT